MKVNRLPDFPRGGAGERGEWWNVSSKLWLNLSPSVEIHSSGRERGRVQGGKENKLKYRTRLFTRATWREKQHSLFFPIPVLLLKKLSYPYRIKTAISTCLTTCLLDTHLACRCSCLPFWFICLSLQQFISSRIFIVSLYLVTPFSLRSLQSIWAYLQTLLYFIKKGSTRRFDVNLK